MMMLLEGKGAVYIQDRGVSRWDTCGAQAVISVYIVCICNILHSGSFGVCIHNLVYVLYACGAYAIISVCMLQICVNIQYSTIYITCPCLNFAPLEPPSY